MRRIDLSGKRFGRLLVLNYEPTTKPRATWLCLCDCGNTVSVRSANLRRGDTKSCGCLRIRQKHRVIIRPTDPVDEIVSLYRDEHQSIPQIARKLSQPRSRVRSILLTADVQLRTKAQGVLLRRDALGSGLRGKKRQPFSNEHRSKIKAARIKHGDMFAKGISKKAKGYIVYTRGPNKGRLVHDVIMETRLGRRLLGDEVVHHIDTDG